MTRLARVLRGEGFLSPMLFLLVAMSLVPLAGVLLFGWDLGSVVLLYWAETAIMGLFAIVKTFTIPGQRGTASFFILHFGTFALVTGSFLVSLFVQTPRFYSANGKDYIEGAGPVLPTFVAIAPAAAAIFVGHAVGFVKDFLVGGERAALLLDPKGAAGKLVWGVYLRVGVIMAVMFATSSVMEKAGSPRWGLVVLVALKLLVDVGGYTLRRYIAAKGDERLDAPGTDAS